MVQEANWRRALGKRNLIVKTLICDLSATLIKRGTQYYWDSRNRLAVHTTSSFGYTADNVEFENINQLAGETITLLGFLPQHSRNLKCYIPKFSKSNCGIHFCEVSVENS